MNIFIFPQKRSLRSPLCFVRCVFEKQRIWLVAGKFSKTKMFFSETIRLRIHAYDISLYIVCIFIVIVHQLLLLYQFKISTGLQWEKWKVTFLLSRRGIFGFLSDW